MPRLSPRPRPLAASTAALLLAAASAAPQTFTSTINETFSDPLAWNFGAGPVPASDAGLALTIFSYRAIFPLTAANDLNLTLNRLDLAKHDSGGFTLSSSLGGDYAFAGGAGLINLLGSGSTPTLSAPVVLAQGLDSLTVAGPGASGLTISGVISSNMAAGAPLVIATEARNAGTGVVSLSGANTFAGGVVLDSGTLSLGHAAALGARRNVLTINGGHLRGTVGNAAHDLVLNASLDLNGSTPMGLSGVLGGTGGVTANLSGTAATALTLAGRNTYTGATTVRGAYFATAATDGATVLAISSAAGSILHTSGILVSEGGGLVLDYALGHSAANSRVSTTTAIGLTSGLLAVAGNTGVIQQSLGTVNAGGLTTILAATDGGSLITTAGAATEITIANLHRAPGGAVTFTGRNLGAAPAGPGAAATQANILLTQIDGGAPTAALVGGGEVGTSRVSILPWALGDTVNQTGGAASAGIGFVTYGPHGVRLLDLVLEYNTSGDFTTADPADNMRLTGAATTLSAPAIVNSLFVSAGGAQSVGGQVLTLASGALAATSSVAVSSPLNFGGGGAGEAIVSVIGPLNTSNTMTLSGAITAGSLVKSGHGRLELSGTGNSIAGPVTIDGGRIVIPGVVQLGGATALTFHGHSYAAGRSALDFTHGSGLETLTVPIVTHGGMAGFSAASGGTLALDSPISGAGGVRFDGAGTTILGGTNTYAGGTYLGGGTLEIDGDARLGDATDPLASFLGLAGGTLRLTGAWNSARAISIDGVTILDTQAHHATLSGPLSGPSGPSAATLRKIGAGTLTIASADNGFTGTIQIGDASGAGGTVRLWGEGALNSARVVFGSQIAASPPGTYLLDLSGATAAGGTPWRSLASLSSSSFINVPHEVRLGASAAAPVDLRVASGFLNERGSLTGFGKLVKVGQGTFLVGSTGSTFAGGVEIWGGTLSVEGDEALGDPANGVVIRGGTFSNASVQDQTARGFVLGPTPVPVMGAAIGNIIETSSTLTISGVIDGAGGFNKTGSGSLALRSAANSYAGDTQVTEGTLDFQTNAQLGAASSRLRLSGGTLSLSSTAAVTVPRAVLSTAAATVNVSAGRGAVGSLELAGPLLGSSTLTKTGRTLFLSGESRSFFGTLAIASGDAALLGNGQMRRGSLSLAASSGAVFTMDGLEREFSGVGLSSGTTLALGSAGKLTTGFGNNAITLSGTISGGSGASFTKVGAGGVDLASGTHTFTGGFHALSGATINLYADGALPLQSALTLGAWGDAANRGPRLLLDNTATNLGNRLDDDQAIYSNAGEIQFSPNPTASSSETIGSLRGAGMTTVTMAGGALNFADASAGLTRVDRGTFRLRGGDFGNGTASATLPNLTFGSAASLGLIGGGGNPGGTNISILPYVVAETVFVGEHTFVTTGPNGLRLLGTAIPTEFSSDLSTAAPFANVKLTPGTFEPITLGGGADKTVNSLILADGFGIRIESAGAEKLILGSGALLNDRENVGIGLGIHTAELQTGAGNTRELHLFTSGLNGGGHLDIGARITTSGGLTKSGAANLYLTNSANTYTGPTTVNAGSLVIDSLGALGSSDVLQIGGGFLKYRGLNATLTLPVLAAGGSATSDGGSAGFHVVSGITLTVGGGVSGHGGILKDGAGVLKLIGANTQRGATIIAGGTLAIDDPATLGANPRVIFSGSTGVLGERTLRFDAPMTLTQEFITNTSFNSVGFGFDTNGHDVTLAGTLLSATSTRGLAKFGAGELNLTATEMYTGATQIFGGTLRLSGPDGSVLNSTGTGGLSSRGTIYIAPGAALVLDNTAARHDNRLPDVWDTPFGTGNAASGKLYLNGGELQLLAHATGASERINSFDLVNGTVTLAGGGVTLTSGRFTRASSLGAGLVRGTNLGALPGPASTNWFLIDLGGGSVQLNGAGGAEATPFLNIVPGLMGDARAAGLGTDFMTHSADVGLRLLTAGEYAAAIPAGVFDPARVPNVALTGAATIGQRTAINALKLGAGASVGGPGALALRASTVLATGDASIDVTSLTTAVGGANAGYIFLTPNAGSTLTVRSALPGAGFATYGKGTLALEGRFNGTGAIVVGQGTLRLAGSTSALNPIGSAVTVARGATFDLGGADRIISGLATPVDLSSNGSDHHQRFGGTVQLGPNRLTLYDAADFTFSGDITGTGGLTKPYFSSGTTTLTQPLTYTGPTVLRGGALELSGAGELRGTSALELRGGRIHFNNADPGEVSEHGGYLAQRIGATIPVTVAGGEVVFGSVNGRRSNAHTPADHALGPVTLAGQANLYLAPRADAPTTVTLADVLRSARRGTLTVDAIGGALGLAPSPVGNARILLTKIEGAAPGTALLGAGGAVGGVTQSILPWAWLDFDDTFFTLGADGLLPLSPSEYAVNLALATANVRTTAPVTLTAPATANSLIVDGGNLGGAHDLTLTSGALAVTGTSTIGSSGRALFTGAGNTRELVLNIRDPATLHYNLTTSGGVTKFGPVELTLAGVNTFTGGFTINEGIVKFSSDLNLGAPGGAIRIGGDNTLLTARLTYQGAADSPLAFDRPIETASFGLIEGLANHRWQFNQPISGAGGIAFSSTSSTPIFELNAANTYTGQTVWFGGHLYIRDDSAFGAGGELVAGAAGRIVLRGDWHTSRLVHAQSVTGIQTNGHDATWSGSVIGAGLLAKAGAGTLTLTETVPWRGALSVSAGEVRLRDRGSIAASTSSANLSAGASFTLDDTGVHSADRLADATGGVFVSGGSFNLLGNPTVVTEEMFNVLLTSGAASLTLAPGAGQAAILRVGGSVTIGGSSLWRGTNLGVNTPGAADSATIVLTPTNPNAFPLTGGGAPAGLPSISVIRGGFGDTIASGFGTQLVTYDLEKGVRLLDPRTEFTATVVDGSVVTDNVRADGVSLSLAHATTINALWLKDGASVAGAGTLTLGAGSVLVTGTGNSVSKPLSAGVNALAIGGPGEVTFTASIPSSQTGGLIKHGAGTLTLEAANSYTGPTILAAGLVNVGHSNAFGATTVQLQGAELRATTGSTLPLSNNFTLNGPMIVGGAGQFGVAGNVTLNNATREFRIANTETTQLLGIVASSQSLVNYGVTKTGHGPLYLSNDANTYDGPTTIREGVLMVDTVANGGAPSGLGAGYSDADKLVLDGGTLRYSGPAASTDRLFTLTENGGTIDSTGTGGVAFTNPAALAVTGSGPRTLTLSGSTGLSNTLSPILSGTQTALRVDTATWITDAAHTYTGDTIVTTGGTLKLIASGSISGSKTIALADTPAKFDVGSVSGGENFDGLRFTLRSGQTLRGRGSVLGPLSIGPSATLAPQTLRTGDLFWTAPDATLQITLDWSATPSTDLLTVAGSVSISNSRLELLGLLPLDAQTFLIIDNDSTEPIVGTFGNFGIPAGYTASIDYAFFGPDALGRRGDGNDIAVTLTPVPEPATAALLLSALPALFRRCRPR